MFSFLLPFASKIISDEGLLIGKVKYNDKILHQSKILRYYTEGENKAKVQKDINKGLDLRQP